MDIISAVKTLEDLKRVLRTDAIPAPLRELMWRNMQKLESTVMSTKNLAQAIATTSAAAVTNEPDGTAVQAGNETVESLLEALKDAQQDKEHIIQDLMSMAVAMDAASETNCILKWCLEVMQSTESNESAEDPA